MCGITGYLATSDSSDTEIISDVEKMTLSMSRRGPDASGIWISRNKNIVLGHRRLSIIDLSANANQPMINDDESLSLVFNGEIYNFLELKEDLKKRYKFKTNSDTEVILALYSIYGVDFVEKLRGMFSIAIWDNSKSKLFLSRDGYGIKPLYYFYDEKKVIFSSQVKPFLNCRSISLTTSPGGVVSFLNNGYIQEPFTLYNEIKALPAGTSAEFHLSDRSISCNIKKHTCIKSIWEESGQISINTSDAKEAIEEGLKESVRYHLVSDVPIGLFLSSGIDSSALLGLINNQSDCLAEIKSLTLGFPSYEGTKNDETIIASEIANYFNSDHYSYIVKNEEMEKVYDDIFQAMDQPSIDGINSYLISKFAKDLNLKVAISGLGGDELFGGYPSFSQLHYIHRYTKLVSKINKFVLTYEFLFDKFNFISDFIHPKAKYIFRSGKRIQDLYNLKRSVYPVPEIKNFLESEFVEQGTEELQKFNEENISRKHKKLESQNFMEISFLESSRYMRNQLLRDADWASMYHSLEVRTPLVDTHLLKKIAPYLLSIKTTNKKSCLLDSAGFDDYFKNKILNRPKSGFTTPVSELRYGDKIENKSWEKLWSREIFTKFLST